ncbi:MAG: hypothetical protein QM479_05215 [Pseudomonadota bacterium]
MKMKNLIIPLIALLIMFLILMIVFSGKNKQPAESESAPVTGTSNSLVTNQNNPAWGSAPYASRYLGQSEHLEPEIAQVAPMSNAPLYFVIVILSLTTFFAIAISFYLYKWRKILLSNKELAVPEKWADSLIKMGEHVRMMGDRVNESLSMMGEKTNMNTQSLSSMTDTYMELQHALDEKDQEIARLKTGYDAQIYKRFILRFARIDQTITDEIEASSEENELLSQLSRLFEDAFDECGVSKFAPEIGEDYRTAQGVSDHPKTKKTQDEEQEFNISEIIESGYQINVGENPQIIIPSKVRIYKFS